MKIKSISKRTAITALVGIGVTINSGIATACSPEPYIGEVCPVGYTFCPRGYAEANGQLLQIASNTALFSLFGTIYGGDGRTTFGLPDLRDRSPVHAGRGPVLTNISIGQSGGSETTVLSTANLPAHSHLATTNVTVDVTSTLMANSAAGNSDDPTGKVLANRNRNEIYSTGSPNAVMSTDAISSAATVVGTPGTTLANTGSGQPFTNRSPYLGLRYCIALEGQYPTRN